MAPLLILVLIGGLPLLAACFVIGIMGVREFYNGFGNMGIKPSHAIGYASAVCLYAIDLLTSDIGWYMLWFFGVTVASLLYLFKIDERKLEDAMATITGVFYVIFFSYHVTLTEQTGRFGILVWIIFLSAFGTDIMAYFTGRAFGKHKLCPTISPKKTVEGSIGGIIGSVVICLIFGRLFAPDLLIQCVVLGVIGGVISQFGDLTASVFKRKMGIKDYGNLIPGHGGIMDRFDSVLFTAPMVYYYIALVLA